MKTTFLKLFYESGKEYYGIIVGILQFSSVMVYTIISFIKIIALLSVLSKFFRLIFMFTRYE